MLGYVVPAAGAEPEFREVAVPAVGEHEVLIAVLAASINPVDALVGASYFAPKIDYHYPAVFGRDICGRVERVGASVTRFLEGDLVWGFVKRAYVGDGSFAEYVAVPDDRFVVAKPSTLDVLDAGALGLGSVTALECLDALELSAGQTVLVNRASGGVGCFAVQIAAARGLRVIATARPGDATTFVEALGAHHVVDWTTGDLAAQVRALAPDGVDGVVDLVRRDDRAFTGMDISDSQAATEEAVTSVLRPGGRFSNANNNASQAMIDAGIGFNVHSTPTHESLQRINDLVSRAEVRVPLARVFAFEDIRAAFAHQQEFGRGKTGLTMAPAEELR